MAIQYPTFQGDPTVRPDFSGISDLPKNVMEGIKIGMLPSNIKQQRQQQALRDALIRQQMAKEHAQAGLYGAQAGKTRTQADALRMFLGGQPPAQQPQTEVGQQLPGGPPQYPQQQPEMQQPGIQPPTPQQQPQAAQPPLSYESLTPRQRVGAQFAGLDLTKAFPGAVAREQEQAKEDVKRTSSYLTQLDTDTRSAAQLSANYGSLISRISDPDIINAVGPLNSVWQKRFPDENAGQLMAELQGIIGNIKLSIIQKGVKAPAAMARFADEFKPSINDTLPVFRGKVIAGKAAQDWEIEFNRDQGKYIARGMSPQDAAKSALRENPFESVLQPSRNMVSEANAASSYKRKFPGQEIRQTDQGFEVSIPGSSSFVNPINLKVVKGKLYAKVPGTNSAVPVENYDNALASMGGNI